MTRTAMAARMRTDSQPGMHKAPDTPVSADAVASAHAVGANAATCTVSARTGPMRTARSTMGTGSRSVPACSMATPATAAFYQQNHAAEIIAVESRRPGLDLSRAKGCKSYDCNEDRYICQALHFPPPYS